MIEAIHKKAQERMLQKRLPNFKYGLTINIPPKIELEKFPKINGKTITVIESQNKTIVRDTLTKKDEEFFNWNEEDKIQEHNLANVTHLKVIEIKETQKKPIIIKQTSEGNQNIILLIKVYENVNAKIIFIKKTNNKKEVMQTEKIRIVAEKNSILELTDMYTIDDNTTLFDKHETKLKQNARIKWTSSLIGSNYRSTETQNYLEGDKSRIENTIVFFAKNNEKFNISTNANHIGKNTKSKLTARGAVKDKAQVLTRGIIKIEKEAKESEGYQKQDSLLLSEEAEVDSMPMLEIDCDDVTCSHGSTIGHIDEEKKFYLQTRGLNEKEAIEQIIRGYFEPIINEIPILTEHIEEAIK